MKTNSTQTRLKTFAMLAGIAFLLTSTPASAIGVKGYAGLDFSSPSANLSTGISDPSVKGGTGLAAGVGAEVGILPFFNLGVDLLYVQRKVASTTSDSTSTFTYFLVPVMLWFSPISLVSVGAG